MRPPENRAGAAARPLRGKEHKGILSPLCVGSQAKPDESVGSQFCRNVHVLVHRMCMIGA